MFYKMVSSYKLMIGLFMILAIGASVGTFIENDYGSARAKELVYNAWWYQLSFFIASINLIVVIDKTKMYRVKARTLFHGAFIIILFGAAVTHYFGLDGMMHIREGEKSNIIKIGDEQVETPFYIALKDFTLTRYPGSRSPSEFSSDVTVIDEENDKKFDAQIYMNNTLVYGGYKFFQTSYDDDEKGTKLSVNKDPGVEITYIGYALLFLGLILNLFDKKSRFQYLIAKMRKMPIASMLLPLLFIALHTPSNAGGYGEYIDTYLEEHRENSKVLSQAFGTLVVQGPVGRMKPLDTQNREVLSKLTGRTSWEGMDANQVVLGMFSRPELWKKVNIIRIKTPRLREKLGVDKYQKLVKFTDFFDNNGSYKLTAEVERANQLVPSKRGTFERDLIQADERLNIAFMSYRGVLLTLFPLQNNERNKWVDFKTMFATSDNSKIKRSTSRLLDAAYNRQYDKGFSYIEDISAYQKEFGKRVYPDEKKLEVEIWFNNISLFFRLSMVYLIFGLVLLVYGITSMFYNRLISSKIKALVSLLAFVLFAIHTFGIGLRWYIGGYAPISNTYETMVYIAYASVLAGVVFLRKSTIALSASFMMAGIFIFAAYLGEIDPEITNLVPVLKSYWLSVHVSVITASYGFFGVGAILGLITLILFMLRSDTRKHIDTHIKNIRHINEVALTLGLTLLVIGNFLGGIWANESWGRYWGWDPKETWAYISILVYVMVLHIRLIKSWYSVYLFSVLSVLSFFSILMTYFGVNFYLAGMHSYATGDPVPIPNWVYIISGIVLLMMALAYPRRKLNK
ncbi:MAG: cytochrome c biogenesis protein CcsA [Sulfurovum sp.]|nr:cytochrome c biogenesis protein CcsA [Sulfurovum sp.]